MEFAAAVDGIRVEQAGDATAYTNGGSAAGGWLCATRSMLATASGGLNHRSITSSPWAYDGKIYLLDEDGTTAVVQAGPQFELVGTNTVVDMVWATPAVTPVALYLRGAARVLLNQELSHRLGGNWRRSFGSVGDV